MYIIQHRNICRTSWYIFSLLLTWCAAMWGFPPPPNTTLFSSSLGNMTLNHYVHSDQAFSVPQTLTEKPPCQKLNQRRYFLLLLSHQKDRCWERETPHGGSVPWCYLSLLSPFFSGTFSILLHNHLHVLSASFRRKKKLISSHVLSKNKNLWLLFKALDSTSNDSIFWGL